MWLNEKDTVYARNAFNKVGVFSVRFVVRFDLKAVLPGNDNFIAGQCVNCEASLERREGFGRRED